MNILWNEYRMRPNSLNPKLIPVSCRGPLEVPSEGPSDCPYHRQFGMRSPIDVRWCFPTTDDCMIFDGWANKDSHYVSGFGTYPSKHGERI